MTTSEPPAPAGRHTREWRTPPRWLALLLLPIAVYLTVSLTEKHGLAVGVLAGVVYGGLALVALFFNQVRAWSKAHPVLDSLVIIPLIFLALAYVTPLPLLMCAAVTAVCGLTWLVIAALIRRRHDKLDLDRVGGMLSSAADAAVRRDATPPVRAADDDEPGRPAGTGTPPA
jgi:hypothetical protein